MTRPVDASCPWNIWLLPCSYGGALLRLRQGDAAKLGAVYDSIASGFVEKGLEISAVEPVRCGRASIRKACVPVPNQPAPPPSV